MNDPIIASVFDRLDQWRHLPSYQLERRADIFFSLFLPDALNSHLKQRGITIDPGDIIPEFPLKQTGSNRSDKVDFFAVSNDRKNAFLIELKTDMDSVSNKQLRYLRHASNRGADGLLCGLKSIVKAAKPKPRIKYCHLLRSLEDLGLITPSAELQCLIRDPQNDLSNCIDNFVVADSQPSLEVVLVLPKVKCGWDCIDFENFACVVDGRGEVGTRFAESLREWACWEAGSPSPRLPDSNSGSQYSTSRNPTKAPPVPLHGVDFSGAEEREGRNRKLWIASWHPDRQFVSLECGGDEPGFGRRGLTERIIQGSGLWVIDFPFGPPFPVADAAGWDTWEKYLAWCEGNSNPTALRDELRTILSSGLVPWSTRRNIDVKTAATWFPFFQQLYRQTITGARDVLAPLNAKDREVVAVLPFHGNHEPIRRRSVLVEGFPGWTLAKMGMPSTGYKGSAEDARGQRAAILDNLRSEGIPINDSEYCRAVGDNEGDGVDALVLLRAAWRTLSRGTSIWIDSGGSGTNIEGWYFD